MAKALKENLDARALKKIASILHLCDNSLNVDGFIDACSLELESLELKARVKHIADHLHNILPNDFASTAIILQKIPEYWEYNQKNSGWFDYASWPIIDYVGIYGIDEPEISLELLKKLTHLFSAEFALRPFLDEHFEYTVDKLHSWCSDEDEHVRRVVSECTRLRLPWATQIPALFDTVDKTLPLILKLVDDESLYVRKSVSNHLNDLSKTDPELVMSVCEDILKYSTKNREWLVKRALRTLRKNAIIS